MFIVITASLLFWLPAFVVYTVRDFCPQRVSPPVHWFVNSLHLANSMVTPFVYIFMMPIFKEALKKFWRRRRQNHAVQPAQADGVGLSFRDTLTPRMVRTNNKRQPCQGTKILSLKLLPTMVFSWSFSSMEIKKRIST